MPSPFPGMNPYLERPRIWHGFHERLIAAMADAIQAELTPPYFAEIGENVYVRENPELPVRLAGRPDVYVGEGQGAGGGSPIDQGSAVIVRAPYRVRIPEVDIEREGFIEVRDANGEEVISVIELLSPSNKKPGPDRDQYLAKRGAFFASPTNFIEIDLLRGGGPRMPWQGLPLCDYYVVVSRSRQRPEAGIWPLAIRDELPRVPIPLRDEDQDVILDLQRVLHRVYDAAAYQTRIYNAVPEPKLSEADQFWAESLVRAART